MSSAFDERSGVVQCVTPWGYWYQTAEEVYILIEASTTLQGKDVHIKITPSHISCFIHGEKVFDGDLCHSILVDESTWSVEDKKFVRILLAKALRKEDCCWRSLLAGEVYAADQWTFDQMQKKVTLEKYEIDQPGFDFSSANVSGDYMNGGAKRM